MNYITIDGGTSSTRVNLVENYKITDSIKLNIGARSGIDNKGEYVNAIKEAIENIVKNSKLSINDIECILASGMITSEFGLVNLKHINLPAGVKKLKENIHTTKIEEISSLDFNFVPGVKINSESFEQTDLIRGEETEVIGIIDPKYNDALYILCGSHSKIMKVNQNSEIISFATMLTGEMITALSQGTILKDAVCLDVTTLNDDFLLSGYDYTCENGINEALFKVRILKNIYNKSKEELYSFFMGIILCGEINHIIKNEEKTIVLSGRKQIKNAMSIILNKVSDKKIVVLSDEVVDNSTTLGVIKIYES